MAYNEADKKFSGLLVEVMDIIVDKLGIEYELYTEASGAYGMIKDKDINGIIGEVYHKVCWPLIFQSGFHLNEILLSHYLES